MFHWRHKSDNTESLTVDSSNAAELRAARVWRLVIVLWCTWLFFTSFLWYRGYELTGYICIASTIVHLIILLACRGSKNYRLIMNLFLVASAVGLFSVSISHPALAGTMLFFPVSILVASQLLGVRDAFYWLIINLVAFTMHFIVTNGFNATFTSSAFDGLVLFLGVGGCVFFCCQQGEQFYQERTRNLFELSERLRRKGKTLKMLATTDALTGLMNRFHFQERLQAAVGRAMSGTEELTLFLIDMDGFKEINDTLGHPVGDDALVEIATRLQHRFHGRADVARLGGDEFCIIYPNTPDTDSAALIAAEICQLLTQRYVLKDAEFPMGASVGFAACPAHTESDQDLLAYADTAMFHAKENRLGYACYEPNMTDRLVEYRTMQERLSNALEQNEFFLVYQPQVSFDTGRVVGVEALLRWRHDGEVIPPIRFIPLLEQSREIIAVGRWVFEESCRQLAEWSREGYDISVSFNVSAVQFEDETFFHDVADAITRFGVDPTRLDCEITEGLLIDNVQEAVTRLNQLKRTGVTISIDDFGTGYSSLAYLRQFPLDRLKIDRAFVKDIPDADDGLIAASIIVLAKSLGLKVLAEGVETDAHIDFLQQHDCDEYQGYYLSRPVPANEVVAFFERTTADAVV